MGNHFIVVDSLGQDRLGVFDGLGRRTAVAMDYFLGNWDGNVLLVKRPDSARALPLFKSRNPAAPLLEIDHLYIDAGDWLAESQKEATFTFKISNYGQSDLLIQKALADCACTAVEWPKAPIPRGSTSTLKATYRVSGTKGPFQHHIVLMSNDPVFPQLDLFIAGSTLKKLEVSHRMIDFGELTQGQKTSIKIYFRYIGNDLLHFTGYRSDVPGLDIHVSRFTLSQKASEVEALQKRFPAMSLPQSLPEASNTFVADLTLTANGRVGGELSGDVVFDTNLPNSEVRIPLRAKVVDHIVCYPRSLFLGDLRDKSRTDVDARITLEAVGGEVYQIDSVVAVGIQVPSTYPPGASGKLAINFRGPVKLQGSAADRHVIVHLHSVGTGKSVKLTVNVPVWLLADKGS
jgi:Protein of unknown function (DUF1573)